MATFKHSGDLGDIIYALPTIKSLGGGTLFLDTTGGAADPTISARQVGGRTQFNERGYHTIRPLLLEQPYIERVEIWTDQVVDYDLNRFRDEYRTLTTLTLNIAAAHLRAFKLDEMLINEPWLTLQSPLVRLDRPLVINRTPRYQSKHVWWQISLPEFLHQAVFVGHEKEHEIFEYTFNCKLPYYPTADALAIAQVLKGCDQLIGNQSFVMAIAAGLGTTFMQERYEFAPNCVFERENAFYM